MTARYRSSFSAPSGFVAAKPLARVVEAVGATRALGVPSSKASAAQRAARSSNSPIYRPQPSLT